MSQPIEDAELKYFHDQHYEEVVCRSCKEWTTFGESCCDQTRCEDECPYCKEFMEGA